VSRRFLFENTATQRRGYSVEERLAEVNNFGLDLSAPMNDEKRVNYPRRPPRLELLFSSVRPFYFVTFNTHRRQRILERREIHESFRQFCNRAQIQNVAVGRYVIMPDHIHLFLALPPTGAMLPKWVQMLKTVLGKELLRLAVPKPHWQEGFFDHVLRNSESYGEKWNYVRLNPVRAGFCTEPEEWEYRGEIVSISF
jgi:putative transposase